MTIKIPDGVVTTYDELDARPDRHNTEQLHLAMWTIVAHPVEREKVLRSRLNDPANRHEFIDGALFGENVHPLLWDGCGATDVVGNAGPVGVHLGNFTFPTASIGYKPTVLERWDVKRWAQWAPMFFRNDPDRQLEIVRRRLKSHPAEFTRHDTLAEKGGDYGAADWVHVSGDDRLSIWELDYAHPAQRII